MWHIWMSERRIFLIESRKLAMLALARKLAPGFVLMHWREAFLKQLCIFISFRRAGLVAALVCLPAQFRREYIAILFSKHWFCCCCCCWTQCGWARRDFFFVVTAHRVFFSSSQPFVLGAAEPRQPVVLFMRACPNQSADFSIFYKPEGSWSSTPFAHHNNTPTTQQC